MERAKSQKKNTPFWAALALTAALLLGMALLLPASDRAGAGEALTRDMAEDFDMYVHNAVSAALDGVRSMDKVYRLPESQLVAPEPEQALFGSTSDPAAIGELLDSAAGLLGGQETLLRPDTALFPGTELRYYLDDTILALVWQENVDNVLYTFSEVRVAHASQFKRMLAGDAFGSGIQYRATDMASSVNAVVAINGDFYAFRGYGIVVYQRELYRVAGEYVDTCFFDSERNMHMVRAGELTGEDEIRQYIRENDIVFSVSFGPVLVEEGVPITGVYYPIGEVEDRYARAAIGQLGELHYLLATANASGRCSNAPTITELAKAMAEHGCVSAYTLDGGQTATLVMNDVSVNPVQYGAERNMSDILYFATALPD